MDFKCLNHLLGGEGVIIFFQNNKEAKFYMEEFLDVFKPDYVSINFATYNGTRLSFHSVEKSPDIYQGIKNTVMFFSDEIRVNQLGHTQWENYNKLKILASYVNSKSRIT